MTPERITAASKWLSWALRHDPTGAGIVLDAQGWTPVADLLAAANRAGHRLDRSLLDDLVRRNDKQRFAFDEAGGRIRANQGHSQPVDLGLESLVPPDLLYHGTADRFVAAILAKGIQRQSRQQVHLSAERTTATSVGGRHGRPVVLTVASGRMHADGHRFYRSANGVWLTDEVPATYVSAPA